LGIYLKFFRKLRRAFEIFKFRDFAHCLVLWKNTTFRKIIYFNPQVYVGDARTRLRTTHRDNLSHWSDNLDRNSQCCDCDFARHHQNKGQRIRLVIKSILPPWMHCLLALRGRCTDEAIESAPILMHIDFPLQLKIDWWIENMVTINVQFWNEETRTPCHNTYLKGKHIKKAQSGPSCIGIHMLTARNLIHIKEYTPKTVYTLTTEPKRLHHTLCRQPCGWKVLGLQRGITYEVSRHRRS
jgi:hypothetical protein